VLLMPNSAAAGLNYFEAARLRDALRFKPRAPSSRASRENLDARRSCRIDRIVAFLSRSSSER
jgi:hypothetical protein